MKIEVPSEKEIPGAIDRLADSIRQKLSLPDEVMKELKASSFQPTSQSVAALRDYNQGVGLQREGRNLHADINLKLQARKILPSRWLLLDWHKLTVAWAATLKLSNRLARLRT